MNLSLQAISSNNYEDICNLKVSTEQRKWLTVKETSSTDSLNKTAIIDSMFSETLTTRGIYLDETAVGFIMWDKDGQSNVSISSFMIGHEYQQQGIGRIALELAITEINKDRCIHKIELYYHLDNSITKKICAKLGFEETGKSSDDSNILAIKRL